MENDFMLNEDKIRLMTSIAMFEKHEETYLSGKPLLPQ